MSKTSVFADSVFIFLVVMVRANAGISEIPSWVYNVLIEWIHPELVISAWIPMVGWERKITARVTMTLELVASVMVVMRADEIHVIDEVPL